MSARHPFASLSRANLRRAALSAAASVHRHACAFHSSGKPLPCRLQPLAAREKTQVVTLHFATNVAPDSHRGDDTPVISNGVAGLCKGTFKENRDMTTRKQSTASQQTTGRVVHDAKGNSVWLLNEGEREEFRDTQTWVVRALEVPGLSLEDEAADPLYAGADPYNRKR
jgi:hypothetical protein